MLQSVTIYADGVKFAKDLGELEKSSRAFFKRLNGLKNVTVDRIYIDWSSHNFRDLTLLNLCHTKLPSGRRLDTLLRACPTLEQLRFKDCELVEEDQDGLFDIMSYDTVDLPILKTLTCAGVPINATLQILGSIHAPDLSRLTIDVPNQTQIDAVVRFISTCRIIPELGLVEAHTLGQDEPDVDLTTNEKILLLSQLSNLKALQFEGGIITDDLLKAMDPSTHVRPPCLCPKLAELSMCCVRVSPTRLAEMILGRHRWDGEPELVQYFCEILHG
jgi:hypothetical protein